MSINLAQIKSLLVPGLYTLTGKYPSIETQWSKVFDVKKSTLTTEVSAQMRYFGLAALKQEGGPTTFDNNAGQRFTYNATTNEVGLGFSITRKAIDDNQYKSQFSPNVKGLMDSFKEFKEYQASDVFNSGQTYNSAIGGDGKALFATDHPVDGGTIANTFTTQQQLNETSLIQAYTNIRTTFLDEAGLKRKFRAKKLIVHPYNLPTAVRLVDTYLRPGTANNDVNVIPMQDGGVKEYFGWDYLTSNYYWFLTTTVDSFIMFQRVGFESDMHTDFTTQNLLTTGYERYIPTYNDWRGAWGSFPSS